MNSLELPRRAFLGLASAAAAACAVPNHMVPKAASAASDSWAALRSEFLLTQDRIHLANLLLASNPRVVRDSVERWRKRLDDDPVTTLEHDLRTGEYTNGTLDAAARYLAVTRDQIALTDSTTSGLALIYGGLVIGRGDEIVTTAHDHFVTHESLRLAAERSGAVIRTVPLYESAATASAVTMVRAIESAITPKTRAVAVTWVHSSTGVKTPVRAMSEVVRSANSSRAEEERILLCVDGVHGFGVENVSMADLGCDFFVAGCHKWILGPRGTGLVWGRSEAWRRIRPVACPFQWDYVMAREHGGNVPPPDGRVMTPGGFRAYEHRWALREAFQFHLDLGKPIVMARIHELSRQCKLGLKGMRHVTLHTPVDDDLSSGIVCFEVAGLKPDAVEERLRAAGIVASTTPYVPSYARLTPSLVNTPDEIERTLAAIRGLG
jgi:selenocysteine lyase/cysteine desulfurase